jgi:putative endonuclease
MAHRRDVGQRGEQVAADHLVRRGFWILQRNYRTRWGEIDIIACDGHTLAFCEVKSRRLRGSSTAVAEISPFDSLHPRKRVQVRRMAQRWIGERFQRPYASVIRFDAIGVTFDCRGELLRLEHLEGAF